MKKAIETRPKCSCGFRVRGPNHEKGDHYKRGRKTKG